MILLEKETIITDPFVETRYTGHNSLITICGFKDEPSSKDICRLEHQIELLYAPVGVIQKDQETGEYKLDLDFSQVQCSPERWLDVKRVTDEMLALWEEFLQDQQP